jgi:uncharacterized membrane protein
MNVILFNLEWMSWNLFLAVLGVIFGWFLMRAKTSTSRALFGILWFLFVPNTIYILTDVYHLTYQWSRVFGFYKFLLSIQYIVFLSLGAVTFVYGMYFFEKSLWNYLKGKKDIIKQKYIVPLIIAINFLISFGVVMGRAQRTNSWYVFTNIKRVFLDAMITLTSMEFMLSVVTFGIFANIMYFYFKRISLIKS